MDPKLLRILIGILAIDEIPDDQLEAYNELENYVEFSTGKTVSELILEQSKRESF